MRGRVEVGPPGHRNSRLVVSLSPTIKSRSRTWRLWCGADSSHDKPSGQAIVCRMRVPASLKVAPHEQGPRLEVAGHRPSRMPAEAALRDPATA